MKENEILITIPLSEYVDAKLGSGTWNYKEIKTNIAELIEIKCKNTFICAIQWPDKYNGLDNPLLWPIAGWRDATERWQAEKKRSEERRIAKFIFEANMRVVSAKAMKYFSIDDTFAQPIAHQYLIKKRLNALLTIGVTRIITSEEEL